MRNVSLHLPENNNLVAGTKIKDINFYYEFINVTIVGNVHVTKLVMNSYPTLCFVQAVMNIRICLRNIFQIFIILDWQIFNATKSYFLKQTPNSA
jgi:hypothetical protein